MNRRKSLMAVALSVAIAWAVYGVFGNAESDPKSVTSENAAISETTPADHDEAAGENLGAEDQGAAEHAADEQAENSVILTQSQILLAEIATTPVIAARVPIEFLFTGEVKFNQERATHIVPRLTGIVTKVKAILGDRVTENSEMAVIESRELAEMRAAYLTALERTRLALSRYKRTSTLWAQKISPKQDFIDAEANLAENRFEKLAFEQQLKALGYTQEQLERLVTDKNISFTEFKILAPFGGTVIEKYFTKGEFVEKTKPLYVIADLQKVWVFANVYQGNIKNVRLGQKASVTLDSYPGRKFGGDVTWIADTLDERTRTLKIRVEVDNPDRLLKPGMFANVALKIETGDNGPVAPASAILRQKNETIMFVAEGNGRFQRREVKLGRRSSTLVEVLEGVQIGEKVVTTGSFVLKSELEKEGLGGDGGH